MQIVRPFAAVVAALSIAVLLGCGANHEPRRTRPVVGNAPSAHQRMLATLREVAKRTEAENEYLGTTALRQAQSTLESLPPNAPDTIRFDVNRVVGNLEMRFGENQQAIKHLSVALDLLPRVRQQVDDQIVEFLMLDLALAYLRVAETENCVHCTTGESCLFPIQPGGVHEKQFGSGGAVECLKRLLAAYPDNLTARWLLNVALMTLGRYPQDVPPEFLIPPEAFESDEPFPRFKNIARNVGLDTFSLSGGSIVDDFDGDGYLDVVVSTADPRGQLRFFHNSADGSFVERTEEAGLLGLLGGLNLVQADYDNDGDVDVLVLRGAWLGNLGRHPNSLLQNDGKGHFTDVTFDAGLADESFPCLSAAWADYDNDGDLDLYVGNEVFPSQLFRNNGDGTFRDVTDAAGVQNDPGNDPDNSFATKAVTWGDYDGDRYPDLYISNLLGANRLYHNNRDGTFTDVAESLGVTGPKESFPAWFWDFDNDGALDIFVSSWLRDVAPIAASYLGLPNEAEHARLYRGDGKGGFEDVAERMKIASCSAPMGANFGDVDNDGFLDFYLGTGWPEFEALVPNLMFRNQRGQGFANVTTAGGFGHLQKGHGVAFADMDNDGDQDVFIEMGGAFAADAFQDALFENPGNANHWIKVKLVGQRSNRCGIGARVRIDCEENSVPRTIYRHVNSGGSFGANPLRQEIGLGAANRIGRLEVYWPTSDTTQVFHDLAADQFIEITEGSDTLRTLELKPFRFAGE